MITKKFLYVLIVLALSACNIQTPVATATSVPATAAPVPTATLAPTLAPTVAPKVDMFVMSFGGDSFKTLDLSSEKIQNIGLPTVGFVTAQDGHLYFEARDESVIETDMKGNIISNIPLPTTRDRTSTNFYFIGNKSFVVFGEKFPNATMVEFYRLNGDHFDLILRTSSHDPKQSYISYAWTNSAAQKVVMQTGPATEPYYLIYDSATGNVSPATFDKNANGIEVLDFSPMGNKITYVARYKTMKSCVRMLNLDTNQDSLVFCGFSEYAHTTWSPDGRYLAIIYIVDEISTQILNSPNAAKLVIVDTMGKTNPVTLHVNWLSSIAWSPDSNKIAVICEPDIQKSVDQILVYNLDGTLYRAVKLGFYPSSDGLDWIQ